MRYLLCILCLGALPLTASSQTFIQSATINTASGNQTSDTCTYPQNNTAGNTLLLVARTTGATITDSQGNIWEPAGLNGAGGVWYATNVKAGANTVTISYAQDQYFQVVCAEYSGPLHLDQGVQIASGTGTAAASYAVTTTAPGDLILAFGNNNSSSNSGV